MSDSAQHAAAAEPALPLRLFQPADAAAVEALVGTRTLRALDWRLGWGEPLVRYGVDLVETFLDQRRHAAPDALREQFRRATVANFNPRGCHFDGFVARLFECAEPRGPVHTPGYAIGLSVANLPARTGASDPEASMQLLKAIYSREQQLAIVQTLYQSCEDYFVSAVHRFGEHNRTELLTPCWDKFRQGIGTFLMRFRSPFSFHEREWIAIALARPNQEGNPVVFEIVDNRLVPSVALDIGGPHARCGRAHAPAVIAISAALPFDSTREALSAFLRSSGAHGVDIVRAQPLAT